MRERSLISLAALALLTACAAGPDYRAPQASAEPAFVMPAAASEPAATFWRGFADPVLDALIADAVNANADVRLAQARLRELRAHWRVATATASQAVAVCTTAPV